MKTQLAIIGAADGQLPLCIKAKEMGLETHCFAWPKGAVCKDYVDHFYPISIFETDEIVKKCKEIGVSGVVSNASETTASVVNYVAEKLGLPCTPYEIFCNIQNKNYVREKTKEIAGLSKVSVTKGLPKNLFETVIPPFVLKPVKGSSKRGVNFVSYETRLEDLDIDANEEYIAEMYAPGQEYSVESISFNNIHQVVQITEKISTGAPHFVELEHHQPACISKAINEKIHIIIPEILRKVGFLNGATHIEIKIDNNDNIYLIEINPRGGGDNISNVLVGLSCDFDYIRAMIEVSLGIYERKEIHNKAFAGIYYLVAQSKRLLPWFYKDEPWIFKKQLSNDVLVESTSNYEHNGFIIYKSDAKIIL